MATRYGEYSSSMIAQRNLSIREAPTCYHHSFIHRALREGARGASDGQSNTHSCHRPSSDEKEGAGGKGEGIYMNACCKGPTIGE